MNAIQQLAGQVLFWTQPSILRSEYELHDAERYRLLGTLNWLSWARERAIATSEERSWYFDRMGFFNRRVEVREGTGVDGPLYATYRPHWNGNGTLTLASGQPYEWKNGNLWRTQMKWTTADDGEIMKFAADSKLRRLPRSEARIELSAAASDFPDAAFLVVLGWYLMLLGQRDAAAAA